MSKCECGCGMDADLGNRFVKGHNRRGLISFTSNGRWAMRYDRCVECGRTDKKHSREGYCSNCVRRAIRSGKIVVKRDLTGGRWAKRFDACIECGTTEVKHKAGGRCENCVQKKRIRDKGGVNRVEGSWSMHADRCVHCGTTDVPHSARGLCEVCHKREGSGLLGNEEEISCPICGALVSKLGQHIAMKAHSCGRHSEAYNANTTSIIDLFSSKMTSHDVAGKFGTSKSRVLEIWHENFSDKEITDRGKRIRISKISGENNYLYGTIPHTNITKLVPFTDVNGVYHVMRSSWEVKYAEFLDKCSIVWEYEKYKFKYYDAEGYSHYYFPDFYLPAEKIFIEIKGYFSDYSQLKVRECIRIHDLNIKVLQKKDLEDLGICV